MARRKSSSTAKAAYKNERKAAKAAVSGAEAKTMLSALIKESPELLALTKRKEICPMLANLLTFSAKGFPGPDVIFHGARPWTPFGSRQVFDIPVTQSVDLAIVPCPQYPVVGRTNDVATTTSTAGPIDVLETFGTDPTLPNVIDGAPYPFFYGDVQCRLPAGHNLELQMTVPIVVNGLLVGGTTTALAGGWFGYNFGEQTGSSTWTVIGTFAITRLGVAGEGAALKARYFNANGTLMGTSVSSVSTLENLSSVTISTTFTTPVAGAVAYTTLSWFVNLSEPAQVVTAAWNIAHTTGSISASSNMFIIDRGSAFLGGVRGLNSAGEVLAGGFSAWVANTTPLIERGGYIVSATAKLSELGNELVPSLTSLSQLNTSKRTDASKGICCVCRPTNFDKYFIPQDASSVWDEWHVVQLCIRSTEPMSLSVEADVDMLIGVTNPVMRQQWLGTGDPMEFIEFQGLVSAVPFAVSNDDHFTVYGKLLKALSSTGDLGVKLVGDIGKIIDAGRQQLSLSRR